MACQFQNCVLLHCRSNRILAQVAFSQMSISIKYSLIESDNLQPNEKISSPKASNGQRFPCPALVSP